MNPIHVAILSCNSLFAAGIASRLMEVGFFDVSLLDVRQNDSTEKVETVRPDVVVFDSSDLGVIKNVCFFSILMEFPGIQILQVDYEKERVQIYCSQQKPAHEMGEFISLMHNIPVPME